MWFFFLNHQFSHHFILCNRYHVYLRMTKKNDKILTSFGDALCKKYIFFTCNLFARGCSTLQWMWPPRVSVPSRLWTICLTCHHQWPMVLELWYFHYVGIHLPTLDVGCQNAYIIATSFLTPICHSSIMFLILVHSICTNYLTSLELVIFLFFILCIVHWENKINILKTSLLSWLLLWGFTVSYVQHI